MGLREQKKQKTRLAISQVATRLFIGRGFDKVTMVEVAAAAEVSVNTVFNYFTTKEELFLDRAAEFEQELGRIVTDRAKGESVVSAVRRACVTAAKERTGPFQARNIEPFLATIEASPALKAYARLSLERAELRLAESLAGDIGGPLGDLQARSAAAMIMGLVRLWVQEFQARVLRGESTTRYQPALLKLALLGLKQLESGLGDYGVRRSPRAR